METWRDRFKRRLSELKASEGFTQEKLGEMINRSQGTIGHWVHGRRQPKSLEEYEKLAQALRVHPAWLLYGMDPKELIPINELNKYIEETQRAIDDNPEFKELSFLALFRYALDAYITRSGKNAVFSPEVATSELRLIQKHSGH